MVRKYDEKMDERKQTYLAQKEYVASVIKNMSAGLMKIYKGIENKASDEAVINEIANHEATLKNILDNLTYTQ